MPLDPFIRRVHDAIVKEAGDAASDAVIRHLSRIPFPDPEATLASAATLEILHILTGMAQAALLRLSQYPGIRVPTQPSPEWTDLGRFTALCLLHRSLQHTSLGDSSWEHIFELANDEYLKRFGELSPIGERIRAYCDRIPNDERARQ